MDDTLVAANHARCVAEIRAILVAETARRDGKIDFDAMAEAVADHDFRPSLVMQ